MLDLDLEGVHAKIRRARNNLRSLECDIEEFCESEKERHILEIKRGSALVLDSNPPELLVDYSIRVGEIAYNLRSALDHLVWQLVLDNHEMPTAQNEFPIVRCERKYRKATRKKLRGIGQHHASLIERVQPYHKDRSVGQHLWMLHLICNIDKHRYLNVINLHSLTNAHLKDYSVPTDLTYGLTSGSALWTFLKGTEYEDRVEIDVETAVSFRDREFQEANPGYGSRMEQAGIQNPQVTLALSSCLMAVNEVVRQVTNEVG